MKIKLFVGWQYIVAALVGILSTMILYLVGDLFFELHDHALKSIGGLMEWSAT